MSADKAKKALLLEQADAETLIFVFSVGGQVLEYAAKHGVNSFPESLRAHIAQRLLTMGMPEPPPAAGAQFKVDAQKIGARVVRVDALLGELGRS